MLRTLTLFFLIHAIIGSTCATHLCGGDIRYAHIAGLTYQIEVRLYLESTSPADVPELVLSWGDGVVDTIPAEVDSALASACCDRLKRYMSQHTFGGPGVYSPSVIASSRRIDILNIPGSVDVPLCLGSMLIVSPGPLIDSSPQFLGHSVFSYYSGATLTHELMAFDPDGDSLSFELIEPLGADCAPIPGYQYPQEVVPGPYTASVDQHGVFQWNSPQLAGLYTVAIRCTEWRAGEMIGSVTRDLMLCVEADFTSYPESPISNGPLIVHAAMDGSVIIHGPDASDAIIEVLDARGAWISSQPLQGGATVISSASMLPGVYFVRMKGADVDSTVGRFVIGR